MALVDNRTRLSGFESGDALAQPDDLSGAAGGTVDTEIFIEGIRSWGYYTTTSRDGLLYDAGSAQDWSGNTFYLWVNCGVAGLLDIRANGGMAVRFCGETVTNWFEVNMAGSDIYPKAIRGGWVMLVVDIEKAKTASDRTGGTPPATTAIRYVGVTTITGGTMPRMVDNTWLDAVWMLPANTPGLLVEGQNAGPADWTWADILAWSQTNRNGILKQADGGAYALNTPVRFGANDAVTHGFSDANGIVLWEDWDVATNFYGIEVVGGSGTQFFQLGAKAGTGDDATGSQGGMIAAASAGQRFFFDADDANVDACNLYGVQFIHGSDFQLDSAAVSAISCSFVDCSSARVDNIADFLRCLVIDANTADGVAFLTTDDLGDVVFCSFEFSDGHAIEIDVGGPSSQSSKGNRFSGYGAIGTNDASIFNDSGAARTLNVSDGGSVSEHTYRDGLGASTSVQAGITVTVTPLPTGTEVRFYRVSDGGEESGVESSGTSFGASLQAGTSYNLVAINPGYPPFRREGLSFTASQNFNPGLLTDANFLNP